MAHFGELQVPSTQANTWKKMQSHINEQRVSSKADENCVIYRNN